MPDSTDLSLAIQKLVNDPSRVRLSTLWRALAIAERSRALELLLTNTPKARDPICAAIAKARHFRLQTVEKWDHSRLANIGARVEITSLNVMRGAIAALHVEERAELMRAFLDRLEVPNENGMPNENALPSEPFELKTLVSAGQALVGHFAVDHIAFYLFALGLLEPVAFTNAGRCAHDLIGGGDPEIEQGASLPEEPQESAAPTAPTFTTLDQRLIRSIVDCVAEIEGAPTRDEVDDMLGELEALNGARHRTFFHVGFRDSMFEKPAQSCLPAENQARWWWYWAGYICGLERRSKSAEIAQLHTKHAEVRTLADAADGPSQAAASIVFKALYSEGLIAEATAFLNARALAESRALYSQAYRAAIDLIRNQRAAEALEIFDQLLKATKRLAGEHDIDDKIEKSLQRRRALCMRQLGFSNEAERILTTLAGDQDPVARAIARTDLGLIRAGKQRLGDLALPREEFQRDSFMAALSNGEEDFRAGLENSAFRPAHASFALGVLALLRREFGKAVELLEVAHSHFAREAEVYSLDGTFALSELYLGIALCLSLDELRFKRAGELIRSGLAHGAELPSWMIGNVLAGLVITKSDLVSDIADEIIKGGGDDVLEQLAILPDAHRAASVRSALFRRAANPSRPVQRRSADYRAVIPSLLEYDDIERAGDALEFISEKAVEGYDPEGVIAFLREIANFDPAWTPDRAGEARIAILVSLGRNEEAASEVASLCSRLLSSDAEHGLDWAVLLLEQVESWGDKAIAVTEDLQNIVSARIRQRDEIQAAGEDPQENTNYAVRVLVAGGDESVERMRKDIEGDVTERFPNVTLDFLQTGWSGNWKSYADDFSRRVTKADAVVFVPLMRTMLSRTIHERCNVPWRGCRGKGRGDISGAISAVIPMARDHLRRTGASPVIEIGSR